MKKISILIFCLSFVFNLSFAQSPERKLSDYGLSEESVKFLTPTEIKNILNSKTPEETLAEKKAEIEKSGTPEEKESYLNPKGVNSGLIDGIVNCFDYYDFGSVQTSLTAPFFNFNPGDTIDFSGPINNENNYPVVGGTLYVKIFRVINTEKNVNGPDVVDQFIAADNITIPAKGKTQVSFSWKVPMSVGGGNYRIASYFIVDKKFNLLGLSFTDDIIGNIFNFQISGEKANVKFDKTNVNINDKPFYFAAYPPRVPSIDQAVVSAKINNSTDKDETVDIVWNLYKWDSINPDNFIRTVSSKVSVKAKSSEIIKINIPENDAPVYYIVGELKYKDSKSIINVRFVRPEVDKIRLNFPSIMSFPIKSGATSTMFSCLHNSGQSQTVSGGKLLIKITDSNGKIIDEYTYQGVVTGEMMAVKKDFISKKNIDHFFLNTELWQADKLVDQSITEYDCNKIDSSLCNPKSNLNLIISIISIIVILIVTSIIFINKRKKI